MKVGLHRAFRIPPNAERSRTQLNPAGARDQVGGAVDGAGLKVVGGMHEHVLRGVTGR